MFPPFNEELAKTECLSLMEKLDSYRSIDFSAIENNKTPNPKLSINHLYEKNLGIMFGVLVCLDNEGNQHSLKAFSGQFNSIWQVKTWAPPLLDETAFNQLIKDSDIEIHQLSEEIETLNQQKLILQQSQNQEDSKNQSLEELDSKLKDLKQKRKNLSNQSMKEIFDLYEFYTFNGSKKTFSDIFLDDELPPTGCGECCAPKLLSEAFLLGLRPISMAEFYYGPENKSATKHHKEFYPPCDEKCSFILPHILGLEILYQDSDICVINKQSGLLSIPGRGEDKLDSVTTRLRFLYELSPQSCIPQPSVHRLDMDTSGLLVLAFNAEAHRNLSIQFMESKVEKKYYAVLENPIKIGDGVTVTKTLGTSKPLEGDIELKFRLDVENRPHQIYDEVYGKEGITNWRILTLEESKKAIKCFRISKSSEREILKGRKPVVEYTPLTGRTHQLRLHSSHEKGLQSPILGDDLYGNGKGNPSENKKAAKRLMLHSFYLSFIHPSTNEKLEFWALD
ncbi:MAG: pseudouridine synthase [Treponemataceae bacterium]|nr:pseudouridine synthase [Treponemataceae bacterium]